MSRKRKFQILVAYCRLCRVEKRGYYAAQQLMKTFRAGGDNCHTFTSGFFFKQKFKKQFIALCSGRLI